MQLRKSSLYALRAALEMASVKGPVTVADVARRHGFPVTALAKVMQELVRAGIALGSRGVGGGYVLARDAAAISTLQVIEVFDPDRCGDDARSPADGLDQLLDEIDEVTRCTFASVSLETLARRTRRDRNAVAVDAPGILRRKAPGPKPS
ncbi:MAG: Rrf2 family transcriptional regulator [Planctomycetota bacterium]